MRSLAQAVQRAAANRSTEEDAVDPVRYSVRSRPLLQAPPSLSRSAHATYSSSQLDRRWIVALCIAAAPGPPVSAWWRFARQRRERCCCC